MALEMGNQYALHPINDEAAKKWIPMGPYLAWLQSFFRSLLLLQLLQSLHVNNDYWVETRSAHLV